MPLPECDCDRGGESPDSPLPYETDGGLWRGRTAMNERDGMRFFSLFAFCFLLASHAFAQMVLPDSLLRPDSLGIYHPAELPKVERQFYIIPYPVIGYTPDTRWIGGLFAQTVVHFHGSEKPSSLPLKIFYSERKQFVAGIEPELFFGKWRIKNETVYERWPSTFWGIGNQTRGSDEEQFTARTFRFDLNVSRRVRPHLYLGFGNKFEQEQVTELEAGKRLAVIAPRGPRTTSGLGFGGAWDSRDNNFQPLSGGYHQLSLYVFRRGLGSDYTYNRYWLDLRRYLPLSGTHSLAIQAFGAFTEGTPHFENLALLGGETRLRGYNEGRYRDRQYIMAQAEYRFPLVWRLRGAVFAGAGDVADKLSHLRGREFKHSVGGGLRFLLIRKEKISVRLDTGFGERSNGVYLSLNEAF
jgi:hypothetical protein